MKRILKFRLSDVSFVNEIDNYVLVPLKVDYQDGAPYLWAIVDDDLSRYRIRVYRVGTGFPMPEDLQIGNYINTTIYKDGPYVWHWFWQVIKE